MPEEEEAQVKGSKWPLVAGLLMLGVAATLYIYARRSKPCGCGEAQVAEVAEASAEIAQANGKVVAAEHKVPKHDA